MDKNIHDSIQSAIDRSKPDALDKLVSALDMEINIDEDFAAVLVTVNRVFTLTDELNLTLTRFEERLEGINQVMDDEMQPCIYEGIQLEREHMTHTAQFLLASISVVALLAVPVVTISSRFVNGNIVGTTERFTKAAVEFGRGNL